MPVKTITLKPFTHHGNECIGIFFTNNILLNNTVKKLTGVKWSQTNKCWYVLLSRTNYDTVVQAVKTKATVYNSLLKQYL